MEITIQVDDITTFAKALNNAGIAYTLIAQSLIYECEIPKPFEPLKELSDDELTSRVKALADVYKQVEEIEKECVKNDRQ